MSKVKLLMFFFVSLILNSAFAAKGKVMSPEIYVLLAELAIKPSQNSPSELNHKYFSKIIGKASSIPEEMEIYKSKFNKTDKIHFTTDGTEDDWKKSGHEDFYALFSPLKLKSISLEACAQLPKGKGSAYNRQITSLVLKFKEPSDFLNVQTEIQKRTHLLIKKRKVNGNNLKQMGSVIFNEDIKSLSWGKSNAENYSELAAPEDFDSLLKIIKSLKKKSTTAEMQRAFEDLGLWNIFQSETGQSDAVFLQSSKYGIRPYESSSGLTFKIEFFKTTNVRLLEKALGADGKSSASDAQTSLRTVHFDDDGERTFLQIKDKNPQVGDFEIEAEIAEGHIVGIKVFPRR